MPGMLRQGTVLPERLQIHVPHELEDRVDAFQDVSQ